MEIQKIFDAIRSNRIRITDHADEEAVADGLIFNEIYYAVLHGEIIEDYRTSKPYPRYLVYGQTFGGDPAHNCLGV
ncbi:MAG: DUF4258 domain-containing protein [Nitrospiraceae bacterium]